MLGVVLQGGFSSYWCLIREHSKYETIPGRGGCFLSIKLDWAVHTPVPPSSYYTNSPIPIFYSNTHSHIRIFYTSMFYSRNRHSSNWILIFYSNTHSHIRIFYMSIFYSRNRHSSNWTGRCTRQGSTSSTLLSSTLYPLVPKQREARRCVAVCCSVLQCVAVCCSVL